MKEEKSELEISFVVYIDSFSEYKQKAHEKRVLPFSFFS